MKRYYSVRDNCGPAALDFITFAHEHGVDTLKRAQGYFRLDVCLSGKKDFTTDMKKQFIATGLDWNSDSDRQQWIEQSDYADEWKQCPHYWVVDAAGKIYDPSGRAQFLATGLAADLDNSRYTQTRLN